MGEILSCVGGIARHPRSTLQRSGQRAKPAVPRAFIRAAIDGENGEASIKTQAAQDLCMVRIPLAQLQRGAATRRIDHRKHVSAGFLGSQINSIGHYGALTIYTCCLLQ
jgi:hypothetical protein